MEQKNKIAAKTATTEDARPVIRYVVLQTDKPFSIRVNEDVVLPHRYPTVRKKIDEIPYRFVLDSENPDLIMLGCPVYWVNSRGYFMSALLARRAFGAKPVIMTKIGEPDIVNLPGYDYVFSSHPPGRIKNYENFCVGIGLPIYLIKWHQYRKVPKTKFCNYVYSNDWGSATRVRRDFCCKLMQYKPVDCPGRSLNNMRFPDQNPPEGEHPIHKKLYFIKDYKFTIAFENSSIDGYVTEKISHPLAVGSIPIYYGCPSIADYYNPRAFVNCHDYRNFDEVIDRVREIDSEPGLYEEYRNAPSLLPHHYYYDMPAKLYEIWSSIAEAVLVRRAEKPPVIMRLFPRAYKFYYIGRLVCRNPYTAMQCVTVVSARWCKKHLPRTHRLLRHLLLRRLHRFLSA